MSADYEIIGTVFSMPVSPLLYVRQQNTAEWDFEMVSYWSKGQQ